MRTFDMLAQWIKEHPLDRPTLYAELRNQVHADIGITPSNRVFPTLLRQAGYLRRVGRFGTWYVHRSHVMPGPQESAQRYLDSITPDFKVIDDPDFPAHGITHARTPLRIYRSSL